MAVEPRNFLINTNYPIDQIIYLNSGSQAIGGSTSGSFTVAHGLPFTPLVSGSWSLNSDFSVQYEYSSGTYPSGNAGVSSFGRTASISADSTNVTISYVNTLSATTVYYRIFAFQPSDENHDLAPTADSGDTFVLNTNFNYTKVYETGVFNVTAGNDYTVTHNLGYRPQVMAWTTNSSNVRSPLDFQDDLDFSIDSVIPSSTTVVFSVPSLSLTERIDYRIYVDESV